MPGNSFSTEQVWNDLSRRLNRFLLSRVRDQQVAADLLQETFLRIHQNLNKLRDQDRLAPWVFRIARNLVADHGRRHQEETLGQVTPEAETSSPDSDNRNQEVLLWISSTLNGLPKGYREAVRLYELEGLSQREIAKQLDISLPAAKSRILRGREKLRGLLHECCDFELDRRGNILKYQKKNDGQCCGSE